MFFHGCGVVCCMVSLAANSGDGVSILVIFLGIWIVDGLMHRVSNDLI